MNRFTRRAAPHAEPDAPDTPLMQNRTHHRQPAPGNGADARALAYLYAGHAPILNLRDIGGDISPGALLERGIVRVDRATRFGNPFPIGKRFGTRVEVVERYRRDLWRRVRSGTMPLEALAALEGKPLACWCHPQRPCHAEVLARAAVWAAAELRRGRGQQAP